MDGELCTNFAKSLSLWDILKRISAFLQLRAKCICTRFGGCSSKIEPAMPISISSYQRAWQTFSMSHALQIFKNDVSFIDEQMILISFFDSSNQKSTIYEKLNFLFSFTLPVIQFGTWWSKIGCLVG